MQGTARNPGRTRRDLLALGAIWAVAFFFGLTDHGLTNWQESVRLALQDEDRRTLADHEPVGSLIEGTAASGARQRLKGGESELRVEPVGARCTAHEHRVGHVTSQQVAAATHRVERRGTGRVDRRHVTAESEGLLNGQYRQ